MNNGRVQSGCKESQPLVWTGRLLSAEDLRTHLNGAGEIILSPRAIITPLAVDELRASGVQVTRRPEQAGDQGAQGRCIQAGTLSPVAAAANTWGYAQDKPDALVQAAVQAAEKQGASLRPLQPSGATPWHWARSLAACVGTDQCAGGIVFCADAALACCVANKLPGLRAAAALSVAQVKRALVNLGANFIVVEMPGRTFFELRQMLSTVCQACGDCSAELAQTLKELDGHAHR